MSTENTHEENDIIDFSAIWHTYLKKWWWFVVSVVVCVGLAFAYTRIHKPVYIMNANMLIAKDAGDISLKADVGAFSSLLGMKNSVDDEYLIIRSHSMMKQIVDEMELNRVHVVRHGIFNLQKQFCYLDYPIDVVPDTPGMLDTLQASIKFKIKVNGEGRADVEAIAKRKTIGELENASLPANVKTPYGSFTILKTKNYLAGKKVTTNVILSGSDPRAEELLEDVTIEIASKKANMISLSFEHPDVEYGRDLLNNLMDAYNIRGLKDKNAKGEKTLEFVDKRIALLAEDLGTTENQLEKYMREQGLTNIEADVKFQMEMKGLLEKSLIETETEAAVTKMLRDFLRDPANQYSLLPISVNGEKGGSEAAYNELILKRMELEQNAKPDNKVLKNLNEQIEAMRASILESLDKTYESAVIGLDEVKRRKTKSDSQISQLPTQQREMLTLMRDQLIKEKIFAFLLQQREQAAMQVANSIPKGTIIDAAYAMKEPKGMSKIVILLLAFVVGLFIPPVLLYIRPMLRSKFETKGEVAKLTKLPILGEVTENNDGKALVVTASSATSPEVERFRLIRTNLQFILGRSGDKVVLVTSANEGDGKTFVAINLASSLAMLGKRVLLVGMDVREPKLKEYLKLPASGGLTEYISHNGVSLNDIILREPVEKNLDVIVAGPVPPNPAEVLASDRVDELFAQLREMYDYIVVDSTAIGVVSDTFALARVSDATVFVCRANHTPIRDIRALDSLNSQNRLHRLSIVVNGTVDKENSSR